MLNLRALINYALGREQNMRNVWLNPGTTRNTKSRFKATLNRKNNATIKRRRLRDIAYESRRRNRA